MSAEEVRACIARMSSPWRMTERIYNVLFLPGATEIERGQAFREALTLLENRIKTFTSLPIAALDRMVLQKKLDGMGQLEPEKYA